MSPIDPIPFGGCAVACGSALLRDLRRNRGCPRRVAGLAGKRVREWRQDIGCIAAVPRPRLAGAHVAGPALAPALAAVILARGRTAARFAATRGASPRIRRLPGWSEHAFGAAPGRRAALASLRRGRECPLCGRIREAGERALALARGADRIPRRAPRLRERVWVVCPPCGAGNGDAGGAAFGDIVAHTTHARLALLRWELEEQLRRGAWQARPTRAASNSAAWLRPGARFAGTP